ncbi:hypothetical protein FA13DRAFT_342330 [Coprinellus micaceus]|uniref:Uncharacterized protein n=1 Tax=Coprinellus micaceus TaxID=71717 RepID=A0A4Y7SE12_COPMI|nr:hypothetical protein FA13DRAFT_342330 [Coprinellus micaceus]
MHLPSSSSFFFFPSFFFFFFFFVVVVVVCLSIGPQRMWDTPPFPGCSTTPRLLPVRLRVRVVEGFTFKDSEEGGMCTGVVGVSLRPGPGGWVCSSTSLELTRPFRAASIPIDERTFEINRNEPTDQPTNVFRCERRVRSSCSRSAWPSECSTLTIQGLFDGTTQEHHMRIYVTARHDCYHPTTPRHSRRRGWDQRTTTSRENISSDVDRSARLTRPPRLEA